jgi:hypothetical protein
MYLVATATGGSLGLQLTGLERAKVVLSRDHRHLIDGSCRRRRRRTTGELRGPSTGIELTPEHPNFCREGIKIFRRYAGRKPAQKFFLQVGLNVSR